MERELQQTIELLEKIQHYYNEKQSAIDKLTMNKSDFVEFATREIKDKQKKKVYCNKPQKYYSMPKPSDYYHELEEKKYKVISTILIILSIIFIVLFIIYIHIALINIIILDLALISIYLFINNKVYHDKKVREMNEGKQRYEEAIKEYNRMEMDYQNALTKFEEKRRRADIENQKIEEFNSQVLKEYEDAKKEAEDNFDDLITATKEKMEPLNKQLEEYSKVFPEKYFHAAGEISQIIKDLRAKSMEEAINVYINDCYQREILEDQKRHNEVMQEIETERMREQARQNRRMQNLERERKLEMHRHNLEIEAASNEANRIAERANKNAITKKDMDEYALCAGCSRYGRCYHQGHLEASCSQYRNR